MSSQAPRPPHPPPASPAIARVLPMVPELSLFMPGQPRQPSSFSPSHPPLPAPKQHNQPPSQPPIHHNLVPQSDHPPRPHLPPSHHLVPQSDFSREFLRSEATLFLSGSTETPVRRVQFQSDSPDQVRQAGAEHGYQARHSNPAGVDHGRSQARQYNPAGGNHGNQKVYPDGQMAGHHHGDRLRFPDQVQQLNHYDLGVQGNVEPSSARHVQPQSYEPNTEHHNPTAPQQNSLPPAAVVPPQLPSTLPPDIMSVLTWQNDQLAKLQDQVARLLAASPQTQAQHAPPGQDAAPQTVVDSHSSPMLKKAPYLAQNTGKVSVSTSTSTLLPDMQPTLEQQLQNRIAGQEERQDGPKYPSTPSCSSTGQQGDRGGMNTWDSPVLGESASMYLGNTREKEQENVEMMYENILGQVQRLLAQDKEQFQQEGSNGVVSDETEGQEQHQHLPACENILPVAQQRQEYAPPINSPTHQYSHPINTPRQEEYYQPVQENPHREEYTSPTPRQEYAPPCPPQPRPTYPPSNRQEAMAGVSSNTATLDRLRQLGVSFISPSDLAPAPPASNPYNSIFLPKANLPSTTLMSPSPDTSLAINNLALKYLSDAELVKLAGHHNRQANKEPTLQEVRQPAEYSLASHQFLARHGLGSEQGHGQDEMGAGHGNAQRQQPPLLPARPPNSGTEQVIRPAPAVPVLDRVLDITAIRNQSKLG